MREIKAPDKIPQDSLPKVFLAGSTEGGSAIDWQASVVATLKNESLIILNPRRDELDASWEQSKENPRFREQVEWEFNALTLSDYIVMYFDPTSKSPISLLEMGEFARSGKLFVVCPEGFWKKGNVDIACEEFQIPQFKTLDDLLATLKDILHESSFE